jgi:hypothetical protein
VMNDHEFFQNALQAPPRFTSSRLIITTTFFFFSD